MSLDDILTGVAEEKKKYLIIYALGAGREEAQSRAKVPRDLYREWIKTDDFKEILSEIKAGDYIQEALSLWGAGHLGDTLQALEDLLKDESGKVKLDTAKYIITLAGGDRKQVKEASKMDRWLDKEGHEITEKASVKSEG